MESGPAYLKSVCSGYHVAPGDVLVVVDLDRDGWRSVTNDAEGVVSDLAELRPDLLARLPLIPYRDSMGR